MPTTDGLKWFVRLYLHVTRAVEQVVASGQLHNAGFVTALDVAFGSSFFAVVCGATTDIGTVPHSWAPLFKARAARDIAPLQFALAGMNAHINHDLPIGLCNTWVALNMPPSEDSSEHVDYASLNSTLEDIEAHEKLWLLTDALHSFDRTFGELDDIVAAWNIVAAREAAWANGTALWHVRGVQGLTEIYLTTLDRTIGFAGRLLLVPSAIPD